MALATIPGYPRIGKRRELKRAAVVEFFFSVGLDGNFGGGFLLVLGGQSLHAGVDIFQPRAADD